MENNVSEMIGESRTQLLFSQNNFSNICLEHKRNWSRKQLNMSSNLSVITKVTAILLFCVLFEISEGALRNVNLFIEPPVAKRGQTVTFRCEYSLTGAPLYTIKFYRGLHEFYRYTPGEYPSSKVFRYPGFTIDEAASNSTSVVMRNVGFSLTGNYSCEATADAPLYSTSTSYAKLQVVEFPEKRPQLFTEHTRYEPGDVLRANCSAPPSRPRAVLRFSINNIPVSSEEPQYIRTVENLIASRLSLKLQLQAVHFAGGPTASLTHMINANGNNVIGNYGEVGVSYKTYTPSKPVGGGSLVLRCTAQIGDLYQEYKEIELGATQKDPVPARVSASSSLSEIFESYFSSSQESVRLKRRTQLQILLPFLLMILCGFF